MTFTLHLMRGADPGRDYELVEDQIVLGRSRECQIVIDHEGVSRRHARLIFENNRYFIEDLRSRNGTCVNGREIDSRVRLNSGDRIGICDFRFVFHSSPPQVSETDDEEPSSNVLCSTDSSSTEALVRVNAEEKLRAILRISDALGGALDLKRVLDRMLDQLFEIFPQADHGLVLLRYGDRLTPAVDKRRQDKQEPTRFSRTIVEKVMSERRAHLIEDVTRDERFRPADSLAGLHIRSALCAPLLSQTGEAMGVVQLDTSHEKRKFHADDMHLLASVARQAAISVEYARLHREKMKHARLERELDIARQVQYSLLPEAAPTVEGYSFWGHYQAAGEVGGDFYDFLSLPNGNQAVVLGDVAGKGVPAALKMVKISTLCKVNLLSYPEDVEEALNSLNKAVCDAARETDLVSLALCVVDPTTHTVTLANAGHMSPMFCRNDGSIDEEVGNSVRGFMLGTDRGSCYKTDSTSLGVGEAVVLFSDGIIDARNAQGDRYTLQRLRDRLMRMQREAAAEIGQALLEDVRRYMASGSQYDDMSLVVLRRDHA